MVKDKFEVIKGLTATYYKKNGKWHCDDGPAIVYNNGDQEWYIEGKLHREDGPAYTSLSNKYQEWWYDGKFHRLDGPAVIFSDGSNQWWFHGKNIECSSQKEFEKILKLKAFI